MGYRERKEMEKMIPESASFAIRALQEYHRNNKLDSRDRRNIMIAVDLVMNTTPYKEQQQAVLESLMRDAEGD